MAEYQERQLRGVGGWLGLLVFILGIATLLTGVALHVAVAHQAVAALLVWAATACAHGLGRPGYRMR